MVQCVVHSRQGQGNESRFVGVKREKKGCIVTHLQIDSPKPHNRTPFLVFY